MRRLRAILIILVCTAALASAQGQGGVNAAQIDKIVAMVRDSRVSCVYDFLLEGKVKCTGSITVQVPCYKASGNGIDIYSDGSLRWTVDPAAKEVYIELSGGPEEYLGYLESISELKLVGVKKSPPSSDLSAFTFDVSALGKDWVITDLREL